MADQVLTILYNTSNGRCSQSGLTGGVLPDAVAKILATLGINFIAVNDGRLVDKQRFTRASARADVVRRFNEKFNQDPNPYHATDNLTLVLTSV